jgi:hypothetical protein
VVATTENDIEKDFPGTSRNRSQKARKHKKEESGENRNLSSDFGHSFITRQSRRFTTATMNEVYHPRSFVQLGCDPPFPNAADISYKEENGWGETRTPEFVARLIPQQSLLPCH